MSPDLREVARQQALFEIGSTIDPRWGFLAAGKGRFHNFFTRDAAWAIAQSLSVEGNLSLPPKYLLTPAINTIDTIAAFQSKFDILQGLMPGQSPHEVHDKDSPQDRLQELKDKGWPVKQDDKARLSMVVYVADDATALSAIAVDVVTTAIEKTKSREESMRHLEKWWPFVERGLIFDIENADREGNGLIASTPRPGDKLTNKTWRDSHDAFALLKGRDEVIPQETPLVYLANNCFFIGALEAGSNMAQKLGLDGFSESLLRKRARAVKMLHERFWWEQEQTFVPLVYGKDGTQAKIVTNESAIGLFTGAFYPLNAEKTAQRMLAPDLLTPYGTRTRSTEDPLFEVNGRKSYHRGTDWEHMDTTLGLGLGRINLQKEADLIKSRVVKSVVDPEFGCSELFSVTPDGRREYYYEEQPNGDKKNAACLSQSWVIQGVIAITAPEPIRPFSAAA